MVTNANSASGTNSLLVSWQFKDTPAADWLRLTTGVSGSSNPQVDLTQPISFRMLLLPVGQTVGNPSVSITSDAVLRWGGVDTGSQYERVDPGADIFADVTAAGPGNLSYQWYKNGAPISGATLDTLRSTDTG